MASALFVVSEEGYWGEECVEPLEILSDEDVSIDVATPSGGKPVIDTRSTDPSQVGENTAERVQEIHETDDRMRNPKPIAAAEPELYDAVVFPGGHGAEWDVNQDRHARGLLREVIEGDDGKALIVCHAVGILAFARDSDGEFIAEGRDVTGFPNDWEEDIVDEHDCLPDGRKLPYWVEDEVRAVGANWDAELDQDASVTVDGDLITARGPESSVEAGEALRNALGVQTP